MNATVQTDTTRVQLASPQLLKRLKDISELADILDNIDPHSIAERESKELFKKRPAELVEDALIKGKLRERRIVIEAKEAEINRKLLRWTSIAAIAGIFGSLGAIAAVIISALNPG